MLTRVNRAQNSDHPRSRGVYPEALADAKAGTGSSPLARGLPQADRPRRREDRIIPARAGFTGADDRAVPQVRDHPRSRGVYEVPTQSLAPEGGSSPLARGLPRMRSSAVASTRIIPARAGFTTDFPTFALTNKDHPRSRGVYLFSEHFDMMTGGSSPLARGLRRSRTAVRRRTRIIPARAGFTGGDSESYCGCRDHPRSRGVYSRTSLRVVTMGGSSPLARGLPSQDRGRRRPRRIIPARAGFTRNG